MRDLWQVAPRWWRLDPNSRVQIQWGQVEDPDDWSLDPPLHALNRKAISLRQVRRAPIGWTPEILYGPWRTFNLIPYRGENGDEIIGYTNIVDGVAYVHVHALEAPTVGEWMPAEPPDYMEQAA